jgi:hypothetical protein
LAWFGEKEESGTERGDPTSVLEKSTIREFKFVNRDLLKKARRR